MKFTTRNSFKLSSQLQESCQDAVLRTIQGSSFRCHKLVLSLACPLLFDILTDQGDGDHVIILDGFSDQDVRQFLDTIYLVKQPHTMPRLLNYLVNGFEGSKLKAEHTTTTVEVFQPETSQKVSTALDQTKEEQSNVLDGLNIEEPSIKDEIFSDTEFETNKHAGASNDSNEPISNEKCRKKYRRYSCPFCEIKKKRMDSHILLQHPSKVAEFRLNFYLASGLKRERHKCEICQKDLSTKHDFDKHMKSHKDELSSSSHLFCENCGKGPFITEYVLNVHIESHKRDVPCSEDGCSKFFTKGSELRDHALLDHKVILRTNKQAKNKDHQCVQCGDAFTTKHSLKTHIDQKHEGKPSKYNCHICGKSCLSDLALKNHSALHFEPTIHCPECDKLLHTKRNLTLHIRNHHLPHDRKTFQCSNCPKGFNGEKEFESHINVHLGLKPFLCLYCDVGFADKSNLNNHTKRLHPENS